MPGSRGDRLRSWLVAGGLMLMVAACAAPTLPASQAPDPDSAARLVERFLRSAADPGSPDRGWSLLHPDLRAGMFADDVEAYRDAAEASDWAGFDWAVTEVIEEDDGLYMVFLEIQDFSRVPSLLVNPRDHLTLLAGTEIGRPHLDVRYGLGGIGIWGVGG